MMQLHWSHPDLLQMLYPIKVFVATCKIVMINDMQPTSPTFSILWSTVSEKLCVDMICFTTVPSCPPSNHCTQRSLPLSSFDHAELVCSSLSLLSLPLSPVSPPVIVNANSVVQNSSDTEKKETNNGPHLPDKNCVPNNMQSKIIELPLRLWVIFPNIWRRFWMFFYWDLPTIMMKLIIWLDIPPWVLYCLQWFFFWSFNSRTLKTAFYHGCILL